MRRTRIRAVQFAGLGLALLAAIELDAQERKAQEHSAIDEKALRSAASGNEWLTYGRNYAETRFSPLKLINTPNVAQLGVTKVWATQALGAMKQRRWCMTACSTPR